MYDEQYISSVISPETVLGARVPSKFPVLSTANHFHQTAYLTSSVSGDLVVAINMATFRNTAAPSNGNIMLAYNSATVMTQFTAGMSAFTTPTSAVVQNPLNAINFAEDARLVSASVVITYTGSPLTASGTSNTTWFQYGLNQNDVLKREGVD